MQKWRIFWLHPLIHTPIASGRMCSMHFVWVNQLTNNFILLLIESAREKSSLIFPVESERRRERDTSLENCFLFCTGNLSLNSCIAHVVKCLEFALIYIKRCQENIDCSNCLFSVETGEVESVGGSSWVGLLY